MGKNIRNFLDKLKREYPEMYLEVDDAIDVNNYEITAFAKKLEDAGLNKVLLFKNVNNINGEKSEFPVLLNAFCTRELCAEALGLPSGDSKQALTNAFAEIEKREEKVIVLPSEQAAVKEVVWGKIDLHRFPVPMCHADDVGPYFVMTNIMKARSGNFYDITFTKNLIHSKNTMSISAHGHHHLRKIITEYEEIDQPTPVILVLGHHPAFNLSACALMPYGNDDYLTAAAFMNEPLRLTSSETWGEEFLVPADAEIVIEGYVLPHVRKEQNPFGEISGHYQEKMNSPVIEVTAVTHRRGAIMQSIFPGHPEHWILGGIPKEGSVINAIRKTVPTVTGVHLPNSGCGRFTCFISLAENHEFIDVNRAAMIAFTEMPNLKMCIIVDEDIDIFNEREVFWAVATQTHWDRDMQVIKKIQGFREWLGDAVVIIDATRPRDIEFPKHNEIPAEALARIDISKYIK